MKAMIISFPIEQIRALLSYQLDALSSDEPVKAGVADFVLSNWKAFVRTHSAYLEGHIPREVLVTQHRHMARLLRMDEVAELRVATGLTGLSPLERKQCQELLDVVLAERARQGALRAAQKQAVAGVIPADKVNLEGEGANGTPSTLDQELPVKAEPPKAEPLFTAAETPQLVSPRELTAFADKAIVDFLRGDIR